MFFAVFSALLGLLHFYIGRRLIADTRLPAALRRRAWLTLALLWASIPLALALGVLTGRHVALWPSRIAYAWLGCAFYLALALGLRDAVVLVSWLAGKLGGAASAGTKLAADAAAIAVAADTAAQASSPAPGAASAFEMDRRVFMARAVAGAAGVAAVSTTAFGIRSGLGEITTPQVAVRLSRLPKALDGFRITQLSDVHIGPVLDARFLRALVETVNRQKPDLIVITGDLVDGSVSGIGRDVAVLDRLHARYGSYFVTGNHEYYSGCDDWVVFMEKLGIPVLMNERVSIGDRSPGGASFDLLGVPDHHAGRYHSIAADMPEAAAGRDPERELVVLAHQPVQIADAVGIGAGLQLSGHTHGGQLQPFGALVMLAQPYIAGLHRQGGTQIYVSRGAGFWGPPMRVLAPAEVATITLVAG